MVQVCQHWNSQ